MVPNSPKLLDLLSNNDVTFFIPPYQRKYEWDLEHCEVFFDDVVRTCKHNAEGVAAEHFFGTITYFQDEKVFGRPTKLVLIDGQQRITTTMLFLIAMRDLTEDTSIQRFIEDKYLKNQSADNDTGYKIKLKQVETDWNAYCSLINGSDIDEIDKGTAIVQNYLCFKRLLQEVSTQLSLHDLLQNGLDQFRIITIELQPRQNSWENPQEIFESMNSLGKPLSLSDLVRNYLLMGMSAEKQEVLYNSYWLSIERRLKNISDFVRDYMQFKAKKAFSKATDRNAKELYADFKELFGTADKEKLIKELCTLSKYYSSIVSDVSTQNAKVDAQLKDLRSIGCTTAYSYILSLISRWKDGAFKDAEISDILETLFIYFIRRRIIGLAAGENKDIPQLVRKLPELEKAPNKRDSLYRQLSSQESNLRVPNDIEMIREIKAMDFYHFRYAKFILSLVEEKLTKSRPAQDDTRLQIEHIMPQTLNDSWRYYLGEEADNIHQEYVHSIGNLTLIRHNQELGAKSFDEKKETYINHAGLQIAKTAIVDQDTWNEVSIQHRADFLIDYLLSNVIPIPEGMKKTNNFSSKKTRGLSFLELQLIGEELSYIKDKSITVKVVNDSEVLFEGKTWKLSPLTRELETRRGTVNRSGSYQGAQHWEYDGIRLSDIM